jgi:hypothetical protein
MTAYTEAKPMKDLSFVAQGPNTGGWRDRHIQAVNAPRGPERAIVAGLRAWCDYAVLHATRYESEIGDDGVLGPAWEQWGRALRTLLNGETGRLDCGTLDAIILDNLITQGFGE